MTPEKNKQRSILQKPAEVKETEKFDNPPLEFRREAVIQPVSSDMKGENVQAQHLKPNISKIKLSDASERAPVVPEPLSTVIEQATEVTSVDSSHVVSSDGSQTANLMNLSASQIKNEKSRLPTGVYIIIAANLLGFVASFFNTSENSLLYTYSMLFSLMIAVGLILRFAAVRKLYVGLAGLLVVLTIILMIGFFGLQERVDQVKANAASYYSSINQSLLTTAQQQELANQESTLITLEREEGKAVPFFYIYHSLIIVYAGLTVIYLTRPKVKEAFEASSS